MTIGKVLGPPSVEEFFSNRVSAWHYAGMLTGDASGGDANIDYVIQAAGEDVSRYFVVASWQPGCHSVCNAILSFVDYEGDWIDYQLFEGVSGGSGAAPIYHTKTVAAGTVLDNQIPLSEADLAAHKTTYIGRPIPGIAANLRQASDNVDTRDFFTRLILLAFRFKPDALWYRHFGTLNPLIK